MLNSMLVDQTRKYGVVDLDENGYITKTIIPFNYKHIVFQKYGIVSYNFDGTCNAHLFDGRIVCNNILNPLFLANSILVISNSAKKSYIIDYSSEKPIVSFTGFDTILFFIGSSPRAIAYSADINLINFFSSPDYLAYGAHLEELVGARIDKTWGVINRKTNQIYAEFNNRVIVQCKGNENDMYIFARGSDGVDKQLYPKNG